VTREEYLESIETGAVQYMSWEPATIEVRYVTWEIEPAEGGGSRQHIIWDC
jgi:hypothetical protein